MTDDTLLREVEAFLRLTGMKPTRLSIGATSDRHFVRKLRMGRRVWPETAERVRAFMARERPGLTATIERLSAALAFDAQSGTDEQWTRLMTEATNALNVLRSLSDRSA